MKRKKRTDVKEKRTDVRRKTTSSQSSSLVLWTSLGTTSTSTRNKGEDDNRIGNAVARKRAVHHPHCHQ